MKRDVRTLGVAALMAGLVGPAPARADDPKPEDITARMGEVVESLAKKQTGTPVQGEQKRIVADLDALIASLEKECDKCKGGIKRNNPRQGMRDSTISAGTGGIGTLANPADSAKDWGKLSDRERDRILQSMSEGFPPEYRTVLERYYRRLAEEKSGKADGEGARAKSDAKAKP